MVKMIPLVWWYSHESSFLTKVETANKSANSCALRQLWLRRIPLNWWEVRSKLLCIYLYNLLANTRMQSTEFNIVCIKIEISIYVFVYTVVCMWVGVHDFKEVIYSIPRKFCHSNEIYMQICGNIKKRKNFFAFIFTNAALYVLHFQCILMNWDVVTSLYIK